MLFSVFSIYDSGISTWLPPLYSRNKGEMLRQFTDATNDSQSKLYKYPGDFTLFEIGTWNDDTCEFSLHKVPYKIGVAIEFLKKELRVEERSSPSSAP